MKPELSLPFLKLIARVEKAIKKREKRPVKWFVPPLLLK